VLSGDYESIYKRLDVMVNVVEVLEQIRKEAGIFFPQDE
jgi:hypothetical protein